MEGTMNQRWWGMSSLFIIVLLARGQSANSSQQPQPSGSGKPSGEEIVVRLEKQGWEAVKTKDYKTYVRSLAEDFVDVLPDGIITKSEEEKAIHQLTVYDYKLERLRVVHFAPDVTLLVYKATQKATFSGQPLATPTWVSSLWMKRNGRWLNVFVQETKAE
jgi:hypothetical protein